MPTVPYSDACNCNTLNIWRTRTARPTLGGLTLDEVYFGPAPRFESSLPRHGGSLETYDSMLTKHRHAGRAHPRTRAILVYESPSFPEGVQLHPLSPRCSREQQSFHSLYPTISCSMIYPPKQSLGTKVIRIQNIPVRVYKRNTNDNLCLPIGGIVACANNMHLEPKQLDAPIG